MHALYMACFRILQVVAQPNGDVDVNDCSEPWTESSRYLSEDITCVGWPIHIWDIPLLSSMRCKCYPQNGYAKGQEVSLLPHQIHS